MPRPTFALALSCCLSLPSVSASTPERVELRAPSRPPAPRPQDPATFPPLERGPDGEVRLPLDQGAPRTWQAVGPGTALEAGLEGLRVRYERQPRQAFGTALPFRPGSLAGLRGLRLSLVGEAPATVLVSLRAADGTVHSWPMQQVGGEPAELRLAVEDLRPDPFQNRGRPAGPFEPERAVVLSITDISAYLGGRGGRAGWTIRAAGADCGPSAAPDTGAPPVSAAEAAFFAALVEGAAPPDAILRPLLLDALQRPGAGRPFLLLGLAHLWIAAEGERDDPGLLEHLVLAEAWLARCAERDPAEDRLPSWRVPVRLALAEAFGDATPPAELRAPLVEAARRDPGFHGFALGLIGYHRSPDSAEFRDGLAALRRTLETLDPADPSVRNEARWPHNREGFLLLAADYERRAGEAERASALLERIEAVEDFEAWPFRAEVARRRQAWSAGAGIPDAQWMPRNSCAVCHRAR
jgi:hypothetical protein